MSWFRSAFASQRLSKRRTKRRSPDPAVSEVEAGALSANICRRVGSLVIDEHLLHWRASRHVITYHFRPQRRNCPCLQRTILIDERLAGRPTSSQSAGPSLESLWAHHRHGAFRRLVMTLHWPSMEARINRAPGHRIRGRALFALAPSASSPATAGLQVLETLWPYREGPRRSECSHPAEA